MLLGNHDNRDQFIRVFGKDLLDKHGFVQSAIDVGWHRFLLLDTHMPGQGWGSLDGNRLKWLDQALTSADLPCFVCLHHPPVATALPAYDTIGLHGAERFAAVLERHRSKVFHVLFGHCHMSVSGNMNGIPVCGIQSLLYQALPNFADDRFQDAPNLLPAYSLAVVDRHNAIVHRIEFGYSDEVVASG
jgi:3',5'-cyclic AMP phosphodiesterase CpdA